MRVSDEGRFSACSAELAGEGLHTIAPLATSCRLQSDMRLDPHCRRNKKQRANEVILEQGILHIMGVEKLLAVCNDLAGRRNLSNGTKEFVPT